MSAQAGRVLEFDNGARERRAKLPFAAARVIKGARHPVLTDLTKLVWLEIHGLHNGPEGCILAASELAIRLGRSTDGVEKARRVLKKLGLLWDIPNRERGNRESSWFPTIPADCIPSHERPKPAELKELYTRLDGHLEGRLLAYGGTPLPLATGVRSGAIPAASGRQSGGSSGASEAYHGTPPIQQLEKLESVGEVSGSSIPLQLTEVRQNLQPAVGASHATEGRLERLRREMLEAEAAERAKA